MILAMLWALILHSQTVVAELHLYQERLADYKQVSVHNFTTDWQNGMAFCALIHKFRPDLVDFDSLTPQDKTANVELAFHIAETELGVPRYIAVADIVNNCADERSMMLYISELSQSLESLNKYVQDDLTIGSVLMWARAMTKSYRHVEPIRNFTQTCWKNGMAFCALVHCLRPDAIDFDGLHPDNARENLKKAFSIADTQFNIAEFLDADDIVECTSLNEREIVDYVSCLMLQYKKQTAPAGTTNSLSSLPSFPCSTTTTATTASSSTVTPPSSSFTTTTTTTTASSSLFQTEKTSTDASVSKHCPVTSDK